MNALSLDLARRFSGDSLDALLDGGRKRRAKRRTTKKHHGAEALFAALGLDGAKRRKKSKRTAKRRTPPRDPRTGLFLKRGAKKHAAPKRRAHHAVSDLALFSALGLDAARKPRRRKARKAPGASKRALFHALFGAAAKKAARKPARKARKKSYLSPEGFSEEDLKILMALGKVAPSKAAKELSDQEKFIQSCAKSPKVQKLCNEAWEAEKIKNALRSIRAAAGSLG